MRNYAEASAFLSKGRNTQRRTLTGRATELVRRDERTIAVHYHETDVVTYHADGRVVLDSGGWHTVTTKARMNEYSPLCVSQQKGQWYVSTSYGRHEDWRVYRDGVTWHAGKISGAGTAREEKREQSLRKQVRQFAKDYIRALGAGEVPEPSAGDCFFCGMKEVKTGKPLGEATRNGDHIREHLKEKYFVPSLITNAFKAMGAAQVQWWGLGSLWGKNEGAESWREYATDDRSQRMLTRYLYRELGLVG